MSKSTAAFNTALQWRELYRQSKQTTPTRKVVKAPTAQQHTGEGKTPPLAIAALISAFLFAPVGLILGFVAWRQATKRNGKKGMAQLAVVAAGFQILPFLLFL